MSEKQTKNKQLEKSKFLKKITGIEKILCKLEQDTLKGLIIGFAKSKSFSPENLNKNKYRFKLPDKIEKYVFDPHQPSLFNIEMKSDEAVKYFIENLDEVVTQAIKYLLIEAVYKFSSVKGDKGFYIHNKTEQKAFDDFLSFRFGEEKKRIRIKRKTSGKLYWTPSKKRELLDRYEELLPLTQSAKKKYRQVLDLHPQNPKQSLKNLYPNCLPKSSNKSHEL